MQIALHVGAHFTDEGRLLRTLFRNVDLLAEQNVVVPGPGRYRSLVGEAARAAARGEAEPGELAELLLDAILDRPPGEVSRLVLSHPHLFARPPFAVKDGRLYAGAQRRLASLARIFEGHQLEIFVALRDLAGYLPRVHRAALDAGAPIEPEILSTEGAPRWSEFLERLQAAAPEARFTVWCNEDTPLIWGEVLRRLSGMPPQARLVGADDMFARLVTPEALRRYQALMARHPHLDERQRREVMAAFLQNFARPELLEETVETPGFTAEVVEALSAQYDADLAAIAQIPRVRLILP